MAATATMSPDHQITIPEEVRAEQAWRPGQEFVFLPKGSSVLSIPVVELESLRGIARGANGENYRDREDRY